MSTTQLDLFDTAPTDPDVRAWATSAGLDCPNSGVVPASLREAHARWLERPHPVVVHALLPSMGWACGVPRLECWCCKSAFGRPWSEVTCTWCHALGRAWYRWACRVMQGLDPLTGERRNTDPERALLAGVPA